MNETPEQTLERLRNAGLKAIDGLRELNSLEGFKNLLSDLYPDEAHFLYELIQNAEDALASDVRFELFEDRLLFTHDGAKRFDAGNVESIVGIGNNIRKRTDLTAIGKFGVGFKSVFGITDTPRVTSGPFAFEIRNLFCPHPSQRLTEDRALTCFEFPFNREGKTQRDIFEEVKNGLSRIDDSALLFLTNIRRISWRFDGETSELLVRKELADDVVEIARQNTEGVRSACSYWLRFQEPAELKPERNIAVAFKLKFFGEQWLLISDQPLSSQAALCPADGKLHVYFPLEKEPCGLRFHVHGPFKTTVARDSIPNDDPENKCLIAQIGKLAAKSLERIRDLGLLNRECLNVLPNSKDDVRPFFAPIRESIHRAMWQRSLVPAESGGHFQATSLVQGQADIAEQLSDADLQFLASKPEARWAIRVPVNLPSFQLLRDLSIAEWKWAELFDCTSKRFGGPPNPEALSWLGTKSPAWMREFYGLLYDVIDELGWYSPSWGWNTTEKQKAAKSWRIIRIASGEHRLSDGVFLPDEGTASAEFTTLHAEVLQPTNSAKDKARAFLIALGLRQIDERAHVEKLLKHYGFMVVREWSNHVADIKVILAWWKKDISETSMFADRKLFRTGGGWKTAAETFLDWPTHPTGMKCLHESRINGIPQRFELDSRYAELEGFIEFAKKLGVKIALEVVRADITKNPHWKSLKAGGGNPSPRYEEKVDYVIECLDQILSSRIPALAVVVWTTLRNQAAEVRQAHYRPNSRADYQYAPSQLVSKLRNIAWIPDKNGNWRKPAAMTQADLPPDFPYDDKNGWLTAIGFGEDANQAVKSKDERRKAIEAFGIPSELLDALDGLPPEHRREELTNIIDALKRKKHAPPNPANPADFKDELKETLNRPGRSGGTLSPVNDATIPNLGRRNWKIEQEIETAKCNESSPNDRSHDAVRRIWQRKNPSIRAFLEEEYGGRCQICDQTFQQKDGKFNFEALHFVTRTKAGTAWMDREGNALCLCPTCCAKFKLGALEEGDFIREAETVKLKSEGATTAPTLSVILCGQRVAIRYTDRHFLDLRAMLESPTKATVDEGSPPAPAVVLPIIQHVPRRTEPRDSETARCRDCGKPAMPGDDRCYSCGQ